MKPWAFPSIRKKERNKKERGARDGDKARRERISRRDEHRMRNWGRRDKEKKGKKERRKGKGE